MKDTYEDFQKALILKEKRTKEWKEFKKFCEKRRAEKEDKQRKTIKNWIKDFEKDMNPPMTDREKLIARLAFDRGVSFGRIN